MGNGNSQHIQGSGPLGGPTGACCNSSSSQFKVPSSSNGFRFGYGDYPDNAAFWAASAPHYLTIFQPEETRLLAALFPDSAHVDQYLGKAFPYYEPMVLLHAGIIDEPLKRAQMAQVILQPSRLGSLASTYDYSDWDKYVSSEIST